MWKIIDNTNTHMGDFVSMSLSVRLQHRPTGQREVYPALLTVAGPILVRSLF